MIKKGFAFANYRRKTAGTRSILISNAICTSCLSLKEQPAAVDNTLATCPYSAAPCTDSSPIRTSSTCLRRAAMHKRWVKTSHLICPNTFIHSFMPIIQSYLARKPATCILLLFAGTGGAAHLQIHFYLQRHMHFLLVCEGTVGCRR